MSIQTALKSLRSDPLNFLRKHPITIGSHEHGQATFRAGLIVRDHATRVTARRGRTVPATEGVRFSTAVGDVDVPAWSIKMYPWDGVNFNWLDIPAPAANLPQFILTGQLTGCSFLVEARGGGAIRCAHQKHGAGPNSAALRGMVAGLPGVAAYTSGAQYDHMQNQAFIIGVVHKGTWEIYGQRQDASFSLLGVDKVF